MMIVSHSGITPLKDFYDYMLILSEHVLWYKPPGNIHVCYCEHLHQHVAANTRGILFSLYLYLLLINAFSCHVSTCQCVGSHILLSTCYTSNTCFEQSNNTHHRLGHRSTHTLRDQLDNAHCAIFNVYITSTC